MSVLLTDISVQRDAEVVPPRNELYDSFKMYGSNHRMIWGNIVVVKSENNGRVCDVLERDLTFIEQLVSR